MCIKNVSQSMSKKIFAKEKAPQNEGGQFLNVAIRNLFN